LRSIATSWSTLAAAVDQSGRITNPDSREVFAFDEVMEEEKEV
jgi:hypothetical protein